MTKRRVVVTGLGIVCPLGIGLDTSWSNALAGKSGVRLITAFDTTEFPTKFAGLVPEFDATQFMPLKEARKCDTFVLYGIAAGVEAVKHAGLDNLEDTSVDRDRIGVIMGSGIGGIQTIEEQTAVLHASGPRKISPFFIPSAIINMISGHLSILFNFRGLTLAPVTACTTGTHAIGLAFRSIAYGDADVIVAGGAEHASTPLGMAGFSAARALSRRNDEPEKASRPWDKDRDGFVLGDGAGAIVLEEYEHAKRRGATIYGEIVGFGMSSDAFHITRPSGIGAQKAMQNALQDAQLNANQVQYINAHGTSTPAGDVEESNAIKNVLGEENAKRALVSSTKSMTGHLLGAAGAVEAIFTIMAIKDQIAPPTINLDNPDEGADLDYVPHTAREANIEVAISNSFGFGGTNGSLVFQKIS
ncbi:MAG TPA: beta-ketoacyl-ACP synthase II [Gammaproteobacteria bacterium]|nr:beta-ketoacyl-ACP synthase II [Gammaproteobacteria bacterium]